MAEFDWYKCKFLESAENLKALIRLRVGRTPSTTIAREIAACLQQGRLFYEAAAFSPLEIRPLQLFYGMVGFAKALIAARRVRSLATLPQSHGVSDISSPDSRIADLRVRIRRAGTFQQLNDVLAELNRFCYFDDATNPRTVNLPSAKAEALKELELPLKEILSRIPQLESLFYSTFGAIPDTDALTINVSGLKGYWSLSVSDREDFRDRDSIRVIVDRWRKRYPFLKRWCFVSAARSWGQSFFEFGNVSNQDIDEFSEEYLSSNDGNYEAKANPRHDATRERFDPAPALPPLASGFSGAYTYAITAINECCFSEFSLHYLALFLLSSLVRYRPQTWGHAISRTALPDAPADDQLLALVERFLEINSLAVPSLIVTALNPHEDQYANAG